VRLLRTEGMPSNAQWDEVAKSVLSPLGYDVLEAGLKSGKNPILLVRIERKDEVPISLADLERANRALSAHLDSSRRSCRSATCFRLSRRVQNARSSPPAISSALWALG